jgi:acetyl-CoA synthetase
MLRRQDDYEGLVSSFAWPILEHYNIGVDVCDRHADDPQRVALIVEGENNEARRYTFREIRSLSNRLANALAAHGLEPGDRLAVLLPQTPETAIAHVAGWKAGLITIPLFTLFGPDAVEYRLSDSGAKALITDASGCDTVAQLRERLPQLEVVFCIDGSAAGGALDFHGTLARASDRFEAVMTRPDDPAVIIYTSGTTGNPKGALHGHRVLLGHLPGVELPHDFFPQSGDLFWTPADWAWIGGLFDVLMPAWHHGVPVLAHRFRKFDPERSMALMARHRVRNVFLPPTAIKLMRQADVRNDGVALRTVGSGGETLGSELLDWGRSAFGLTINEFYGQTECNLVVANSAGLMDVRPGSMGRAVPGHRVAIVDGAGNELSNGTIGSIAVRSPDPVMFLGYWNNPQATREKFAGTWLMTGDNGRVDDDGYFWYFGRDDDVITSAGYRIGPAEIEECLVRHSAVALAAAIGVPDPIRTEIVKAYVVVRDGYVASPELAREIQDYVRRNLAAHEYPRQVVFVPELPMTATGKIMRRVLREQSTKSPSQTG